MTLWHYGHASVQISKLLLAVEMAGVVLDSFIVADTARIT